HRLDVPQDVVRVAALLGGAGADRGRADAADAYAETAAVRGDGDVGDRVRVRVPAAQRLGAPLAGGRVELDLQHGPAAPAPGAETGVMAPMRIVPPSVLIPSRPLLCSIRARSGFSRPAEISGSRIVPPAKTTTPSPSP